MGNGDVKTFQHEYPLNFSNDTKKQLGGGEYFESPSHFVLERHADLNYWYFLHTGEPQLVFGKNFGLN